VVLKYKVFLLTFHYRPLVPLYNNRLVPSISPPDHTDRRFYTFFTACLIENAQYNTERIVWPLLCIVDLVLASDTIG
jgi:hypothetical protein